MTRDDVIAALERMVRWNERDSDGSRSDAATLRALADALREGQEAWIDLHGIPKWTKPAKGGTAIWIIPAPKVKP